MLKFQWPYLIFLLPLPLVIHYFYKLLTPSNNRAEKLTGLKLPFYDDILRTNRNLVASLYPIFNIKSLLKFILWISLILALMRPIWLGDPIQLPLPSHNIMMAIDISGSMQADDMSSDKSITRLDVVKKIGHQFIEQRKSDKIGLVFFGSAAFVSSPLTLDQDSLHNFLEKTQIGFAGQKTAIGDALGLAIKRINSEQSNATKKNPSFIVLLSDGSNTSGEVEPLEAAKLAMENNIKIYTIGIGQISDNPLDILTGLSLNESELKEIAKLTNGQYFHATSKQALAKIYDQISQLEPNNDEVKTLRPEHEWFIYPLSVTLLTTLLLFL